MKTNWDYSTHAKPYLKRPDYSARAIDRIIEITEIKPHEVVCDVGAGVGHLTIPLLERGFRVVAVEPNDNMRALGIERTSKYQGISWVEGTGENTKQEASSFDFVSFGSSFNVADRELALKETARILKKHKWFACLWNHRDIEDSLQAQVESIIKKYIHSYSYGSRREDQTEIIIKSGLFKEPIKIEEPTTHSVSAKDWVEAWRSHATLARQAGENLPKIVSEIEELVMSSAKDNLEIPYVTRVWVAQLSS